MNTPPHSAPHSPTDTNAPDTVLDRALNKLARNHERNLDQQRYMYGREPVNGEAAEPELDLSDDAQAMRAALGPWSPEPTSHPHGTYTALQSQRRRLGRPPR